MTSKKKREINVYVAKQKRTKLVKGKRKNINQNVHTSFVCCMIGKGLIDKVDLELYCKISVFSLLFKRRFF